MSQVEHILTKIEHLVLDANNTITSDNPGKGTNDRRDYISMEDSKKWKYKDVFPKFKLKDGTPEFSYHLLNYTYKMSKSDTANPIKIQRFFKVFKWVFHLPDCFSINKIRINGH